MGVSLKKKGTVSLKKVSDSSLKELIVGLGWDANTGRGKTTTEIVRKKSLFGKEKIVERKVKPVGNFDCDAALKLVGPAGDSEIIYFGNKYSEDGSVYHCGDNLTGEGEGDDEQIVIDLDKVSSKYNRIYIGVNIYNAKMKHQNFGVIDNAYIRLCNKLTNNELCIFGLSGDDLSGNEYAQATSMIMGCVYRDADEWKFEALGVASQAEKVRSMFDGFN